MFIILALAYGIGYTASPAGPAESASQIMPRTTTAHGSIRTPLLAWGALVVIPALVTAVFLLRVTRREQARYSDRLEQAALAEGHQVALDLRRHLQVLRDEAGKANAELEVNEARTLELETEIAREMYRPRQRAVVLRQGSLVETKHEK